MRTSVIESNKQHAASQKIVDDFLKAGNKITYSLVIKPKKKKVA